MEIIIKNMVCRHCVASVCDALDSLSIPYRSVEIGRATLDGNVSRDDMKRIAEALRQRGFEIIDDPDSAVVERIKHAVQHHVRTESECRLNLSACIE
ncbi:MAG: AraC family transcriptional regulator, partial [Muribaculaceae bacterium]|nr:AraC family transcriptional regulator [Muribaculaceae bacterium]